MLLVQAIQVENVDGICTYEVEAFVNAKPIWKGTVRNHKRTDGFGVLMGHLSRVVGLQSAAQKEIQEAILEQQSFAGELRCPTCRRGLNASND